MARETSTETREECLPLDPGTTGILSPSETSVETDREALEALFNSAGGENWEGAPKWLGRLPMGEWENVGTNAEGRVTHLSMRFRLTGKIAPEIGNLTSLEVLTLGRSTEFGGPIPWELGNLINLRELDISRAPISGPIPPELCNLINLETLGLEHNQLTGEIPPQFGNLTNLNELKLGSNALTGPIPEDLVTLTKLTYLSVYYNNLSSEIPLWLNSPELLDQMEWLNLEVNQFTGCVSDFLADKNDEGNDEDDPALGLQICDLGEDPEDVEALVALYEAAEGSRDRIFENWLGREPIGQWTGVSTDLNGRVVRLEFETWPFREIPPEFGNFTNLITLKMEAEGEIPPELGNMTSLVNLVLKGGGLTGPIPPELGDLSNLRILDLADNNLTGPIPRELANLSKVEQILLTENSLSGEFPLELLDLKNLTSLNVHRNPEITGCPEPEDLEGPHAFVNCYGAREAAE